MCGGEGARVSESGDGLRREDRLSDMAAVSASHCWWEEDARVGESERRRVERIKRQKDGGGGGGGDRDRATRRKIVGRSATSRNRSAAQQLLMMALLGANNRIQLAE